MSIFEENLKTELCVMNEFLDKITWSGRSMFQYGETCLQPCAFLYEQQQQTDLMNSSPHVPSCQSRTKNQRWQNHCPSHYDHHGGRTALLKHCSSNPLTLLDHTVGTAKLISPPPLPLPYPSRGAWRGVARGTLISAELTLQWRVA